MFIHKKTPRYHHYQHYYKEFSADDKDLKMFHNESSILNILQPIKNMELIYEIQDKLITAILKLSSEILTIKQKRIFNLWMKNLTTSEIAKEIKVNPSSISYMLNKTDFTYGGIIPKLRKACSNNKEIQNLLKQLIKIKSEEN